MSTTKQVGLKRLTLGLSTILLLAVAPQAYAAVRGNEAMYVGGTASHIPDKTEGRLNLADSEVAVFSCKKGEIKIPFKQVSSLDYGQKVGRRVGVALAVNPVALLSKKRKHFLSIGYADQAGNKQGVVLELSKGSTHSIVETFQSRSGKKVEFESDEARKHYEKESK